MLATLLVSALVAGTAYAIGLVGALDPSFGDGGTVVTPLGATAGAFSVGVQSDHKVVATGFDQTNAFMVARWRADGTLDDDYGDGGVVHESFGGTASSKVLLVDPDDRTVVAGELFFEGTPSLIALARFLPSGEPDPDFGDGSGRMVTDFGDVFRSVWALTSDASGRLLVAGSGSTGFALARYDADGVLDGGFGTGGVATAPATGTIYDLVVRPSGRIVAAGYAAAAGGGFELLLAQFESDGTLDDGFGTDGLAKPGFPVFTDGVDVARQSDGKLVVAGSSTGVFQIARLDGDGDFDPSFGTGGIATVDFSGGGSVVDVVVQDDQKILAVGRATSISAGDDVALVRFNADGTPDTTFGIDGRVVPTFGPDTLAIPLAAAPDGDDRLVVTGAAEGGAFFVVRYLVGQCVATPSNDCDDHQPHGDATFAVDSETDAVDAAPGDGVCATSANECTLRAAIQEATVLPGDNRIQVPDGEYKLQLAGAGEDAGLTGDLDVACPWGCRSLTIAGAGAATTIIDGVGLDRIFDVAAPGITLGNVTLSHGTSGTNRGSAIRATAAVTIADAVLQNNAGTGGVVSVCVNRPEACNSASGLAGPLTITDTTIADNEDRAVVAFADTSIGGSVVTRNDGAVTLSRNTRSTITGTTVSFNHSPIALDDGAELTLTGSTVTRNTDHGLQLFHATVTVEDSEITENGKAGLDLYGSRTTIRDSRIAHNATCGVEAAGIEFPTQLTLTGSFVEENDECGVIAGGGFRRLTMTVETTRIRRNVGVGLTAIGAAEGANLQVTSSSIRGNGGGVELFGINDGGPSAVIRRSLIAGNTSSGDGAGINVIAAANLPFVALVNSTVTGNVAGGNGGGIFNEGTLMLHNVTLTDNRSDGGAGGIVNPETGATVTIRNSILAGNTAAGAASDCQGPLVSAGYNLVGTAVGCTLQGDGTGNRIGVDPGLEALADHGGFTDTHALLADSPAIDAGDPTGCRDESDDLLTDDQRGSVRPRGGACDLGAFESSFVRTTPTKTATPLSPVTPTPTKGSNPTSTAGGGQTPIVVPTGDPTPSPTPTLLLPVCGATPRDGCKTPAVAQKSTLDIKNKTKDKSDSLNWQWQKGSPTAKSEFGAPDSTTSYGLCVYDIGGSRLALSAEVPAGRLCGTKKPKSCWKSTKTGFTFKDGDGLSDGVRSITLKEGAEPGKAKIVVVAKGVALGLPSALDLTPPVTAQLVNSDGHCWEATFGFPTEAEASRFKAKADPTPAPRPTRTPR